MTDIDVPDWKRTGPFLVEVFYDGETDLAIVSACGNFGNISELAKIESDLKEHSLPEFEKGMGAYTLRATYFSGQYGEYGQCEVAPGWELDFISAEIFEKQENESIPTPRHTAPGEARMSENTTNDGIEVKPGQVWRDLDKRQRRTVTVQSVTRGRAFVLSSNGRFSRIAVKRMHKHATGFELVSEPK